MAVRDAQGAADGPDLVTRVADFLGLPLTAYTAGAPDTAAVRGWVLGVQPVPDAAVRRLRVALAAAVVIAANDAPQTAEAWFQSHVAALDGRSPARVLRDGDPAQVGPAVVRAAHAAVGRPRS